MPGEEILLNSWKEISSFLGLSVRTVQRWERYGLPVHRASGKRRSSVYAIPSELRKWLRQNSEGARNQDAFRTNNIHLIVAKTMRLADSIMELQRNAERLQVRLEHSMDLRRRFLDKSERLGPSRRL
jgi:phage terminase Nu1 subunit (DNA packaging protein)